MVKTGKLDIEKMAETNTKVMLLNIVNEPPEIPRFEEEDKHYITYQRTHYKKENLNQKR